jgi:hypothetical protein
MASKRSRIINSDATPATAAERMRRYRARRREAGFRQERRWVASTDSEVAFSDHRFLELRSLAMHAAIARKIRRQPALLDRARANLQRWQASTSERGAPALAEWQDLLKVPLVQLLEIMTDWNETSIRLRQSTPFAGILSPSERKAIYEAFRP